MSIRSLTTETRRRIEKLIYKISKGQPITLKERIQVEKYSLHIPFIASKLKKAQKNRCILEHDGLI